MVLIMTEMKFHVTQEKHVLQSDECVFEMNTKKKIFLVLPSTITSSSQKQTITLKITLKANFRSRTQDLLKRWEFLFQLEQLVSQKSASGVGRNCAENFFRGGGRTQGLEEDLQKFQFQLEHLVLNSSEGNFGKLFFSSFAEKFPNGILLK